MLEEREIDGTKSIKKNHRHKLQTTLVKKVQLIMSRLLDSIYTG
jgi:hypothetical protein